MFVLRDLTVFEVVETPELRVACSQRIGSLAKVIAQMVIAGLDEPSVFCFKIA